MKTTLYFVVWKKVEIINLKLKNMSDLVREEIDQFHREYEEARAMVCTVLTGVYVVVINNSFVMH